MVDAVDVFRVNWLKYYKGVESLEDVVRVSCRATRMAGRGDKKGVERPHKRKLSSRNTTGHVGVAFNGSRGRYQASLTVDGKRYRVYCKSLEEAVVARKGLEREYL